MLVMNCIVSLLSRDCHAFLQTTCTWFILDSHIN